MSIFLRHIIQYAVRKAASDPRVKEKALKAAHTVADEAKQIAKEDDRAYAAGRAFRRTLNRLMND
ncbi:MAG: hypothetical protein AAGE61_08145 [Pseudomonadota bacterium]